ncbi:hypothetical protein OS493_015231 [Desmophyllum pertusum]|uniref:NACHT domain-containing protein n=1 Tax=Desmophyllum pertusum TaxID=174260 RepID=A0A9W9ZR58_9CNID|nr:hypothetical protein OS493_015231 [Desmophyllum pertusum]
MERLLLLFSLNSGDLTRYSRNLSTFVNYWLNQNIRQQNALMMSFWNYILENPEKLLLIFDGIDEFVDNTNIAKDNAGFRNTEEEGDAALCSLRKGSVWKTAPRSDRFDHYKLAVSSVYTSSIRQNI